jgi:hypothetical protein
METTITKFITSKFIMKQLQGLTMSIETILRTDCGAEFAVDVNVHNYYFSRKTDHKVLAVCSERLQHAYEFKISWSNIVRENWPAHEHGTNILKRKAKDLQQDVIKMFASINQDDDGENCSCMSC